VALALAGCAIFEPEPELPAPPPAARPAAPQHEASLPPTPTPPPGPPRPARKPAPPTPSASAEPPPPVGSAPVQEASRPPAIVRPAADALRQMRPEDVVALLGEPWQRAEAAPAVIWRYVGRGCQLDLYFFLDLQSKVTRVLDYKFLPDGVPRDPCLDELVAERREREAASFGASRPR
jgi:hypothetical protein